MGLVFLAEFGNRDREAFPILTHQGHGIARHSLETGFEWLALSAPEHPHLGGGGDSTKRASSRNDEANRPQDQTVGEWPVNCVGFHDFQVWFRSAGALPEIRMMTN
jgi:hypothetical protein